eukprot:jgi/Chrzof1/3797/Cz13g09060.t1
MHVITHRSITPPCLQVDPTKLSWPLRGAYNFACGNILLNNVSLLYNLVALGTLLVHYNSGQMFPQIFNAPLLATSLADLWGIRWHQLFRWCFTRLARFFVGHGLRLMYPSPAYKAPKVLERVLLALTIFLLSGVLHEYMTWGAYGFVTGWQLCFFIIHGISLVIEQMLLSSLPKIMNRLPARLTHLTTMGFFILTCPLFMEPWVTSGFIKTMWHPVPLAKPLLSAVGLADVGLRLVPHAAIQC